MISSPEMVPTHCYLKLPTVVFACFNQLMQCPLKFNVFTQNSSIQYFLYPVYQLRNGRKLRGSVSIIYGKESFLSKITPDLREIQWILTAKLSYFLLRGWTSEQQLAIFF